VRHLAPSHGACIAAVSLSVSLSLSLSLCPGGAQLAALLWTGYTFTTIHHAVWAQRSGFVAFVDLGCDLALSVIAGVVVAYFA
jgi:hypothetical protein